MRKKLPKILITGGAGFIGSAFVRLAVKQGHRPVVIDKLTYAADLARLDEAKGKFKFYKADICDEHKIKRIFRQERPQLVVHFAAESHVDRSILDAKAFIETNVLGTHVLLEAAREQGIKNFIHISTDEVYGDIIKGKFAEDSPLSPNSPYAASKAAADLLIKSYIRTYNLPAIIIRPCNNYGPWQYPEKLIPLAILKILRGQKVPVYAQGRNIREWVYVEDCAKGILRILQKGRLGHIYNLGSSEEKQNIDVVKTILKTLDAPGTMFEFVKDRLGHDIRYSLDSKKAYRQVNWKPKVRFKDGIKLTVCWCLGHKDWLSARWENIAKLYNNWR
ncbi:MAG: dTDP-glucose 4,6-dehydratase [Candidatus Omnitrophica bacterium]|nr:dTDP-glucose 4,6-dehydratase [Candidatus Omnitrophota bacterium]